MRSLWRICRGGCCRLDRGRVFRNHRDGHSARLSRACIESFGERASLRSGALRLGPKRRGISARLDLFQRFALRFGQGARRVLYQLSQPPRPDRVVACSVRLASRFVYAFKLAAFGRRFGHHSGSQVDVLQLDVYINTVDLIS